MTLPAEPPEGTVVLVDGLAYQRYDNTWYSMEPGGSMLWRWLAPTARVMVVQPTVDEVLEALHDSYNPRVGPRSNVEAVRERLGWPDL